MTTPPSHVNGLVRSFRVFVLAGIFLYVAVAVIAIAGFIFNQRQSDNTRELALRNCEENRILISRIVLRSINSTYEDWLENPESVYIEYAEFLRTLDISEARIEVSIRNTRDILELATPIECRKDK